MMAIRCLSIPRPDGAQQFANLQNRARSSHFTRSRQDYGSRLPRHGILGPGAGIRSEMMRSMTAAANATQPGSKYDRLIAAAKGVSTVSTIVVHPCDESSLRGAINSAEAGIIRATLVGAAARIKDVAAKHNLDIS